MEGRDGGGAGGALAHTDGSPEREGRGTGGRAFVFGGGEDPCHPLIWFYRKIIIINVHVN